MGFVLRVGLLLVLMAGALAARHLDYAALHAMPKSVEKDYYLWRYLSATSCTKNEADKLIHEARRVNGKLAKAYRKKTGHRPPKRPAKHRKPLTAAQKATHQHNHALTLSLLKHATPLAQWRLLKPAQQVYVLNHAGKAGRRRLDHRMDARAFARLTTEAGFNTTLKRILLERQPKLYASLLNLPAKSHRLSPATLMRLGFHALHRASPRIAETYFSLASKASNQREEVDRALFWAYKSRGNRRYLDSLLKSYDLSYYTLLARDILKRPYPATITPKLPDARLVPQRTLNDPIHWAKLKRKIFTKNANYSSLSRKYKSKQSAGFYTYILAKASREKEHYFPMPYRDVLSKLPKKRQAILYAIARQESRFVPTSISTSYALGMMQIMPFLVRHLAKQQKEKADYDAMFDPRTALRYANKHMDYLTRWLQHPLFIAYAYNAGIGYTRRLIRTKHLFNGKGAYEPYLSLELVDNTQARHYGKRVLVNYVIYMNKLGIPLRIHDLLSTLHRPDKTDKFRKRKP